jgi:uncharacterized protein (TIGR03067 family)
VRLVYLGLFVVTILASFGCGSKNAFTDTSKTDPQELARLKGAWQVVGIQAGGQVVPPDRMQTLNAQYVFDGDKLTIRRFGKGDITSTFSVDSGANPKRMMINSNPPVRVIYALEGPRLQLCLMVDENRNAGFPTEFASRPSPKTDLITLERRTTTVPAAGPLPMAGSLYIFSQSTGKLSLNDQVICIGYSGKGAAKNNHAQQAVKDGPIPIGDYMLTGFRDDAELGGKIMGLLPMAGTDHFNRFGRETFAIISDTSRQSGCFIVVTGDVLEKLNAFNSKLRVVK